MALYLIQYVLWDINTTVAKWFKNIFETDTLRTCLKHSMPDNPHYFESDYP